MWVVVRVGRKIQPALLYREIKQKSSVVGFLHQFDE